MYADRRQFLAGTAATAVLSATPGWAAIPTPLSAMFDEFVQAQLRRSPEGATSLGLDTGANADLRARLSDQSPAAIAASKAETNAQLKRLEAVDRAALSTEQKVDFDCVLFTRRSAVAVQAFDFGGSSYGPSPYVVSQQSGAYQSVPDFLDTKHKIESKGDADAYLQRVQAFGRQIDEQTERLRHDAAAGVVPPDFILDLTIEQMGKTAVSAADALVVQSIARRAAAKGLGDGYGKQAAAIYTASVLPALQRQLAEVRQLRARASHDAGIWKLPQGEAFYPVALKATTTASMSAEEVHKFGLDQAKMLTARLDSELRKQGFTKGTVGQRMAALYKNPDQLYPNTDAGKQQAIAYCNRRLDAVRIKLPTVFERVPPYSFEVRRVPPQTEAGAAAAFSQSPAIDGSRPGLVYFNMKDSGDWPKFCLATTVYHEGLPGHQEEGGLALSNMELPLIRKISGFSGYGEGWALYAEQLADEIGMYDDDPLGRLGYLKFMLFRANRCVVDTGLHHFRWTREQAIKRFVDQEGETLNFATREVDRYCVNPGQACSYKIGHSVFTDVRERAKAKMGQRFTLKAYHTAVLRYGRVPLDVLRQIGDDWIARA
ncbi:MAG: Tat pathway signal protein [Sphingomonadales bacterium]|nr:Tat pathway signal protein [Sphingomonadales bacterium]